MMCKRMLRTALCNLAVTGATVGLLAAAASVRADVVTPISNLSQANRLSIFHDYSIDAVGLTTGSTPGSAGGGALTTLLGSWASTDPAGTGRSYELSITPIAGYDSNPEARRVGQGSVFGGADLDAVYHLNSGPNDATIGSPTQISFAYDATGAAYDGTVFNADTFQQTLSGSYHQSLFQDSLYVGFMFDDQFTTEYGNAFLNTFDVVPSIEWFALPQISLEANYDFTRLDYFLHTQTKRNPDANRSTVNIKAHFFPTPQVRGDIPESPDRLGDILRQTLTRVTIGYAAVFNDAAGSDYHYESNRLSVGFDGIKIPRLPDLSLDANYAYEWQNFMDPSVEGPAVIAGTPTQRRRKDHLDIFTLRGNARLFDLPRDRGTLTTFVQWDLIADHSNILARHFNEFVISGGITYRY